METFVNNTNAFHPVLLQTPTADIDVIQNSQLWKEKSPDEIWLANQSQHVQNFESSQEQNLIERINPQMNPSFYNVKPTLLSATFFSPRNINYLQHLIIHTTFKHSGHRIGKQSEQELESFMQKIYREQARENLRVDQIAMEVKRLNFKVLEEVVPIIISNVEAHLQYIKRVDNPVFEQNPLPMNTQTIGIKSSIDMGRLYK